MVACVFIDQPGTLTDPPLPAPNPHTAFGRIAKDATLL
jgi:hypothetical protein